MKKLLMVEWIRFESVLTMRSFFMKCRFYGVVYTHWRQIIV